jgi:hypothetical protein
MPNVSVTSRCDVVNTAPTGTGGQHEVVVAEHNRELQQCHPGQVGGICLDAAEIDRGVLLLPPARLRLRSP